MIFTDNPDYYPTPEELAIKMWHKIPKRERVKLRYILDPEAGRGHLIDVIKKQRDPYGYYAKYFTIEKDESAAAELRGKRYPVIAYDFLSYSGPDKFDAIFMNPPFSCDELHLLKAIDVMYSGHIVCILNAETIRNQNNNNRIELAKKLKELDADIEFITQAFRTAERPTNVEIALVYIHIDRHIDEELFDGVSDTIKPVDPDQVETEKAVSERQSIRSMVADYNQRVEVGTKTLMDFYKYYHKIGKWISISASEDDTDRYVEDGETLTERLKIKLNTFLRALRIEYWHQALELDAVRSRMTSKRADEFYQQVQDNEYMDFTENNIRIFILNLINSYEDILTKAVVEIFDVMTVKFAFDEALHNGNVHYFNGWKTNKAFYVNKKVILPSWTFGQNSFWENSYGEGRWTVDWEAQKRLRDVDVVMNYFDGMSQFRKIAESLKHSFKLDQSRNIDTTYFTVTVYKKGTIHLTFKDDDILRRFNVTACKGKNWLPQDYGVKPYQQLSFEEKQVVNEFEGEKSYEANLNPERTLFKTKDLIQIDYLEDAA